MSPSELIQQATALNEHALDQSNLRVLLGDQILLGSGDPSFLADIILATSGVLMAFAIVIAAIFVAMRMYGASNQAQTVGKFAWLNVPTLLIVIAAVVGASPIPAYNGYPILTVLYAKAIWISSGTASILNRHIQSTFAQTPGTPIILKPNAEDIAKNGIGSVLPAMACAKLMSISVGDPDGNVPILRYTREQALRKYCGADVAPNGQLTYDYTKEWDARLSSCIFKASEKILNASVTHWPTQPLDPLKFRDLSNLDTLNKFQDIVGRHVDGVHFTPGSAAECIDKVLVDSFKNELAQMSDSAKPKDKGWMLAGEGFFTHPAGMQDPTEAISVKVDDVNSRFASPHFREYSESFVAAKASGDTAAGGAWSGQYLSAFVQPILFKPALVTNALSNTRKNLDSDAWGLAGMGVNANDQRIAANAGREAAAAAEAAGKSAQEAAKIGRNAEAAANAGKGFLGNAAKLGGTGLRATLTKLKSLSVVIKMAVKAKAIKEATANAISQAASSNPITGLVVGAAMVAAKAAAAAATAIFSMPGISMFVSFALLFFASADLIPQLILYAAAMLWLARVALMFPLIAFGCAVAPLGHGRAVLMEAFLHCLMPILIMLAFYGSGILFDVGVTSLWEMLWHDASVTSIAVDILTGEAVVKLCLMVIGVLALIYLQFMIVVIAPTHFGKLFGHHGPGDMVNANDLLKNPKHVIG